MLRVSTIVRGVPKLLLATARICQPTVRVGHWDGRLGDLVHGSPDHHSVPQAHGEIPRVHDLGRM